MKNTAVRCGSARLAPSALPYLSFIRFTRPTELTRGMLEPSMCLVLQGRKKVLIGSQISHYGRGSYVLSAIDMPVSGQVSETSLAEPYLGIRITLDPREIAAQIIEHKLTVPKNSAPRAAGQAGNPVSPDQRQGWRPVGPDCAGSSSGKGRQPGINSAGSRPKWLTPQSARKCRLRGPAAKAA
ncbi:AraC family transcriptional regulator [Collimonas pratensis]|uniref:AraC family transcriptional regulator n=1 Tax=Collimonas pratensis TaxID=279113 RepID=UPI00197D4DDB|nr:AraC family transcriptional regulator [Collimonas pratensis]